MQDWLPDSEVIIVNKCKIYRLFNINANDKMYSEDNNKGIYYRRGDFIQEDTSSSSQIFLNFISTQASRIYMDNNH